MSETVDLATLVKQPFELLQEIESRSRQVHGGDSSSAMPSEWVGVGFRIGEEQFVATREQVREVLILPEGMTRVPGSKRWLLGIANLRGHLLPLVDVKLLLGLVVDEVLGFRRFSDHDFIDSWPETVVRCDRFLTGAYERGEDTWPVFNLFDFIESNLFLQAAAE